MGQSVGTDSHPVFSSPAGEDIAQFRDRPVDLVHLARQTGGDKALEEEVLQLFLRQASKLGNQVHKMTGADDVKQAAHQIKGAARAVGAHSVAKCAQNLEAQPSQKACVSALVAEMRSTCDYISSLLR